MITLIMTFYFFWTYISDGKDSFVEKAGVALKLRSGAAMQPHPKKV
jgi:hypothetical protein